MHQTESTDYYWKIKEAIVRQHKCGTCKSSLTLEHEFTNYKSTVYIRAVCNHCEHVSVYKIDDLRRVIAPLTNVFDRIVDKAVKTLENFKPYKALNEEAEIIKQGFE